MKLCHTAQIALSLNVRVLDDTGRPVAAYIAPVIYLWAWLPATLYAWLANWGQPAARDQRQASPIKRNKPAATHWLFDWRGWRNDLPLIALAGWLLVRDRGFCYE